MASVLEALQKARQRTEYRDRVNSQRGIPILPIIISGNNSGMKSAPIINNNDGGPISQAPPEDPAVGYARAVAMNKAGIVNTPVIGVPLGLMNNLAIKSYEERNPEKALDDPDRFAKPFSLFSQVIDGLLGRGNVGVFGYDNINAFPATRNFNLGSGNDPNSDISGSIDSTDQSPSVGIGDDDGTAVA